jgi:hypothetical protein
VGLPVSVGERDEVDVHSLMKEAKGSATSPPSPISDLSLRGVQSYRQDLPPAQRRQIQLFSCRDSHLGGGRLPRRESLHLFQVPAPTLLSVL